MWTPKRNNHIFLKVRIHFYISQNEGENKMGKTMKNKHNFLFNFIIRFGLGLVNEKTGSYKSCNST